MAIGALIAGIMMAGGCVTATDHAGADTSAPEDLFGAWSLELREASGATSYSVMDFTPQGCLYDELVRLDAAGSVESRTVYKGTWEPAGRTLDLREPGEPEVVDSFEVRGDELLVDGVAYRRGRAVPPTLVGTWRSEETGRQFTLAPGGRFSAPSRPGADATGFWDVRDGQLEIKAGATTSQPVVSVGPYQLQLAPGGTYDLIPNDSIGGSP